MQGRKCLLLLPLFISPRAWCMCDTQLSEGFVEPYSQAIYIAKPSCSLCLIIGKLPRIHLFCLSEIRVTINSREKDSIIFSEMHQRSSQFLDTPFINQEAKCWLVCKCNSRHSIPWRGWAVMCRDNEGQFWKSRGHVDLSMLQTAVALLWHGARPDIYLRHFLPHHCSEHDTHFLYIQKTWDKCSHICRRGGIGPYTQDPMFRICVEVLRGHCHISDEDQGTLHGTTWCWRGASAEDLANTPIPGLTCFVLEILSLCWSGAEEKEHVGRIQLNMGRHSLDCEGRWVYLKWVCCWQDNLQPQSQGLMVGIQSHVPLCSTPFVAGWASTDKAHIAARLARSRYKPLSYC